MTIKPYMFVVTEFISIMIGACQCVGLHTAQTHIRPVKLMLNFLS